MLPFPQVANRMVATHRQINALLWAQLRLPQKMSSATVILEKKPTHMRKMCITCRKHALNSKGKRTEHVIEKFDGLKIQVITFK